MNIISALSTLGIAAGLFSVSVIISFGLAMGWHFGRVKAAQWFGPLNTSSTSRVDNYFHNDTSEKGDSGND